MAKAGKTLRCHNASLANGQTTYSIIITFDELKALMTIFDIFALSILPNILIHKFPVFP